MGMTVQHTEEHAEEAKKGIRPPIYLPEEQIDFCVAVYREGKSLRAVASELEKAYKVKITAMTVRKILREAGIKTRGLKRPKHPSYVRCRRTCFFIPEMQMKRLGYFCKKMGRHASLAEYVRDIFRQEIDRQERGLDLRAVVPGELPAAPEVPLT
jgi:hypothetical protein